MILPLVKCFRSASPCLRRHSPSTSTTASTQIATRCSVIIPLAQAAHRPHDPCYTSPGPAPASGLACAAGGRSLRITAAVVAGVDMVSVELQRADATVKRPSIHYTLTASAGQLNGLVSGLEPQTAYVLAVRTHRSGCAEDAGNGTWSELTWFAGHCSTLNVSAEMEEVEESAAVATELPVRWLEVFRLAEGGRTLPDFLDNHDSGDMGGDAGIASVILSMPNDNMYDGGIITRYCVQLQNTTVEGTTTTTFEGAPVESAFADYRSTNPPWLLRETATPYFNFTNWLASAEVTTGTEYASWCAARPTCPARPPLPCQDRCSPTQTCGTDHKPSTRLAGAIFSRTACGAMPRAAPSSPRRVMSTSPRPTTHSATAQSSPPPPPDATLA